MDLFINKNEPIQEGMKIFVCASNNYQHIILFPTVSDAVKQRRLVELIKAFRESTGQCYDSQIDTVQLVLVEGPNKRALETEFIGKTDRGHRVSFANLPVPDRDDDYNGKQNPGLETMYRSSDIKFNKSISIWISPCYN
ncbi:hypothetical protein CsSME_00003353 [Camellia sinensis var. sinensis]